MARIDMMRGFVLSVFLACLLLSSCGKDDEVLSNGSVNTKQTDIQRYGDIFEVFYDNGTVLYFSPRSNRENELKVIVNPYDIYDYSGNICIPSSLSYAGKTFTITAIENKSFQGTAITALELPGGLDDVGYNAFKNCTSLKTVRINGNKGEELDINYSFDGCDALEKVYLPTNVESIIIEDEIFMYCDKLSSINLEKCVSIGSKSFYGANLTELSLDSIRTVGYRALSSNVYLKKVTFGANLESLDFEFVTESFLETLIFKGDTPPEFTISADAGMWIAIGDNTIDVYVPKGCIDSYKKTLPDVSHLTYTFNEL